MSTYLTPSEDLAIDVLMARYRTGEKLWTFESRHLKTLKGLEEKGLVHVMGGIVEKTVRASLTEKGYEEFLGHSSYISPLEREIKRMKACTSTTTY